MRIWSLHPKYLDTKGLVALWRETLLSKNVLEGKTKGYKNHPQLIRFKATTDPVAALASYLNEIYLEAKTRDYKFNKEKIPKRDLDAKIPLNKGQLNYELLHLKRKLKIRCPEKFNEIENLLKPDSHPIFQLKQGEIAEWEHIANV